MPRVLKSQLNYTPQMFLEDCQAFLGTLKVPYYGKYRTHQVAGRLWGYYIVLNVLNKAYHTINKYILSLSVRLDVVILVVSHLAVLLLLHFMWSLVCLSGVFASVFTFAHALYLFKLILTKHFQCNSGFIQ